jgi:hypothetical protein
MGIHQHRFPPSSTSFSTAATSPLASSGKPPAASTSPATIARKEPGFAADFRLGDDTHREIIASASAFPGHLEVTATAAKFIDYSMPADCVTDLQTDLAAIDGKKSEQTDDRIEDIGDNARNRALVKEARDLIKSLGTSAKNRFRRDPAILAEWTTASRLPHPPHRRQRSGGNPASHPAGSLIG